LSSSPSVAVLYVYGVRQCEGVGGGLLSRHYHGPRVLRH
jgi:hypothetical protein